MKDVDAITTLPAEYTLENIKSVQKIGKFKNHYVYDIEVEGCHNFFGNDILVHNSLYVEFGRLTNFLGIPEEKAVDVVLTLWEKGLQPYINQKYEEYAKSFNCPKNLQNLELEKISGTSIMLAKKMYSMDIRWTEPGIHFKSLEHVIFAGMEVVRAATPPFCRESIQDFYKSVYEYMTANNNKKPPRELLLKKIKEYKEKYRYQNPDNIFKCVKMNDYDKFVIDDKNFVRTQPSTPIQVTAAAVGNHMLYKNNKYMSKYSILKSGDKVRFYYTKNPMLPVFGYVSGQFPMEYALPIDYDLNFEKMVLNPINRCVQAIGYSPFPINLCISRALF